MIAQRLPDDLLSRSCCHSKKVFFKNQTKTQDLFFFFGVAQPIQVAWS